jgi:nucleoside-diphosphate-sugar epimerase
MARILITGGAGNLGLALTQKLLGQGHCLCIFDLPQADFSPLETWGVEIIKGNLLDFSTLRRAAGDRETIYHLAALIPPVSERDRALTFQVNVEGTENLLRAIQGHSPQPHLIFASSVCVYGDTTKERPPLGVDHRLRGSDFYSETKIRGEEAIRRRMERYTLLRISGIAIPAFMDPPEVWQFQPEQRIEMICLADLVTALAEALRTDKARGKILNLAGGKQWQMQGRDFVAAFCRALDLSPEKQKFQSFPGWFDWYDTVESQRILRYQETSFLDFEKQLRKAAEEARS